MLSFDKEAGRAQADWVHVRIVLAMLCVACLLLPFATLDPTCAARQVLGNNIDTAALCYDSPILGSGEFDEFDVQWKNGKLEEEAAVSEGTGPPAEMHEKLFESRPTTNRLRYAFR